MRAMAEICFLPQYAEVLEGVIQTAHERGSIDVAVRPDVDPAVVATQVRLFAERLGRPLQCKARSGRVEVRAA